MNSKKEKPVREKLDFESSLGKLKALVEQLENNETKLEDSLNAFQKGIKLTREAQKVLTEAEQQVQTLIEANGELVIGNYSGDVPEA